MVEKHLLKEFKNSLPKLLAVPCLEVAVASAKSKRADIVAGIEYQGLRFDAVIEVASPRSLPALRDKINRLKSLASKVHEVPVLAAPYLSPQRQRFCRNHGVCFMDLCGNVHLSYRSFYLEKIGYPNKFPEKRQRRSPFSDKASLILRELLKTPSRQWGVRELAQKIDLNPGYVSRMADSLEELGYASRVHGKLQIRASKEILDDWVGAYDLKKNEARRFFCMAAGVEAILRHLRDLKVSPAVEYAISVQAGANLVAPHAVYKEVHLYVQGRGAIDFFKRELDLQEAEEGANLVLMRPYYKHSVFHDRRRIDGLPVVSDIQLYLDLYKYPLRGREQAEHLYGKRLKDSFENRR